jgi:type IX secretion system PorP/SprF family membrane protein
MAIGLVGLYDNSSGVLLKTNSFAASLAYHLFLDKSKSNKLSIGFQTGVSNKYLDFQNITFANQFTSNGFDLSIPSNQIFTGSQKSYLDISTGLNFSHIQDEFSYFFGFAFYHLNEPKFSFLGDDKNSIPLRTNVNLGGAALIGQKGKLQGSALFSLVGPATDVLVGLTYAHELSNNFHDIQLRFGSSFRVNESFIPYIGYTYDQLQIGISYDIVNAYLVNYNAANRSLELSIVFQLDDKAGIRKLIPWY